MRVKTVWLLLSLCLAVGSSPAALSGVNPAVMEGIASWYGEAHRGKLMANGEKFDPDRLTAASWFYPLGTRVRVSLRSDPQRSVLVIITDRGPAKSLLDQGRIIDLTHAAFGQIAPPRLGLVAVTVQPVER
jgi:rare lipoprotein A